MKGEISDGNLIHLIRRGISFPSTRLKRKRLPSISPQTLFFFSFLSISLLCGQTCLSFACSWYLAHLSGTANCSFSHQKSRSRGLKIAVWCDVGKKCVFTAWSFPAFAPFKKKKPNSKLLWLLLLFWLTLN